MTATTSKTVPDSARIADPFKGVLLDAYGVFWGGNAYGLLPGSKDCMERLVSAGKVVGILSNTTQLAAKELAKLQTHGLIQGRHFHFLITSGEVTRSLLLKERLPFQTPRNKFWLFGGIHPKYASHEAIFQGTIYTQTNDLEEADFIYISIPHINGEDQTDPERFREEVAKLRPKNLPMLCSNPDQYAHEGNPPKAVVRQGSIARIYAELGGPVYYVGKPHQDVYEFALRTFQGKGTFRPDEILMVGDTPETDIRGARGFGIPSALVTQTGMMADRVSLKGREAAFRELLLEENPDYFIGQLNDI